MVRAQRRTARINRKIAISRIATTIVEPAAAATSLNSRSPCHFARAVSPLAQTRPGPIQRPVGVNRVIPHQIMRWR
jgi:hypothetical protein